MTEQEARKRGAAAFITDKRRTLADAEPIEDFLAADGSLDQAAARAWYEGWDAANLAAPVPGVDKPAPADAAFWDAVGVWRKADA